MTELAAPLNRVPTTPGSAADSGPASPPAPVNRPSLRDLFYPQDGFDKLSEHEQNILNGIALLEKEGIRLKDLPAARQAPAPTLSAYLPAWVKAKHRDTNTGQDYLSLIRSHIDPGLGHYRLTELSKNIIDAWVNDLKLMKAGHDGRSPDLAVATKKRVLRCLHAALADAELQKNPADGVQVRPKEDEENDRVHPFSPPELDAILSDNNPHRDLYRFAVETGTRRNESIAEQRRDFICQDGKCFIWVARSYSAYLKRFKTTKSRERRLIELFPGSVEIIQRRLQQPGGPQDLIFRGENGRLIHPSTVTHDFQDLLRRLGIAGHCFHDLRHTHATYLLNNHWSVAEVARRLGHRDATVTMRTYANWLPGLAGQLISQKPDIFGAQSVSTVRERESKPSSLKVGHCGFEPQTPVLSGLCSNQLS
jgi:integrase